MLEKPDKFGDKNKREVDVPDEFLSKKGLADKILREKASQRAGNTSVAQIEGKEKAGRSSSS
jgi:hypothetical protein